MIAQTARSRRLSRENNVLLQGPSRLRWLAIIIGLLLIVGLIALGIWFLGKGHLGKIALFEDKPQKVYLPVAFSTAPQEPTVVRKTNPVKEFKLKKYEITYGDTLYDLALANDISLELLLAANPKIKSSTILNIGDIIFIPPVDTDIEQLRVALAPAEKPVKNTASDKSTGGDSSSSKTPKTPTAPVPLSQRLTQINGVPIENIIVMPASVVENIRNIFVAGQEVKRNPQAFAKIGDSTIASPFFMDQFDNGPYNLGDFSYLQKAVNNYKGSFAHQGPSVQTGMTAWSLFDPMWTNDVLCMSGESPIECEFRVQNPSITFIQFDTFDPKESELFISGVKQLIDTCVYNGIIPILGTTAEVNKDVAELNQIMRDLAIKYSLPLWDYALLAQTLPDMGLNQDGIHLTDLLPFDFTQPNALQTGYGTHSLTAVMYLYELWRILLRS